jgi:two-component system response regulator VicR
MARTILIVDDDPHIVDILTFNLERESYGVLSAMDGLEGLQLALEENPDLILLDVMLPGMNGFEICQEIRKTDMLTPILMLTAREEERDRVLGLESGADDYVIKPFGVRELLARIKRNLRRIDAMPGDSAAGVDPELASIGRLTVNYTTQSLFKDGCRVDVTQREYELICFMAKTPGKICTREELITEVWNYDFLGDLRIIDVAIRRLREKLEDNPAIPAILITKRNAGYYLGTD